MHIFEAKLDEKFNERNLVLISYQITELGV